MCPDHIHLILHHLLKICQFFTLLLKSDILHSGRNFLAQNFTFCINVLGLHFCKSKVIVNIVVHFLNLFLEISQNAVIGQFQILSKSEVKLFNHIFDFLFAYSGFH